jgi:hypothetical protein
MLNRRPKISEFSHDLQTLHKNNLIQRTKRYCIKFELPRFLITSIGWYLERSGFRILDGVHTLLMERDICSVRPATWI